MNDEAYLRELSDLGRRHGVGLTGRVNLYQLAPEDMAFDYSADADGSVYLGSPGDAAGEAAEAAVANIGIILKEIGVTDEQAFGFQGALRLALLGKFTEARSKLALANYEKSTIDQLMAMMSENISWKARQRSLQNWTGKA